MGVPEVFRSVWLIASWDVRRALRQKETLLWTFVMPVLFFWFMGTMTGGHGGAEPQLPRLALWQEGQPGFLGNELALRLEARGFEVVQPESREQFDRYSRRVVVPEGFTAGVIAGEPQAVELLRRRNDLNSSYDQLRVGRAVYSLTAHTLIAERPLTAESYRDLAEAERALSL
ncbi:MAG: ABC-type Na+ efflux pump permease subunit, partial [Pseudohongiellaceae bacterium]